jgi:Response regulator containing a CheY-like receiver domain and an HD-GYP domain
MKFPLRVALLVVLGGLAAAVAEVANPGGPTTALVSLVGAVALGELVVLRPPHRAALPLAYAFMLVLVRAASPWEYIAAIAAAEVVVLPLRSGAWSGRVRASVEHFGAGLAALVVYRLAFSIDSLTPTPRMLTALALSGIAAIGVHELCALTRSRRLPPLGGADLALVASGMLMAIGFRGVAARESVGLWSVVLFSIPLLAAWYSFERLAVISRTSEQTIEALSLVPEMAGLAPLGHAARVAELSVRVGDELGLRRRDLDDLRAAALLHHLGHLCLDAEEVRDRPVEPSEVADKGAEILRQTDLANAGNLLATDDVHIGGQILRVVSAFDDLVARETEAGVAIDALYSGPGFVYDPRVLEVLDRIVGSDAAAGVGVSSG